MNIDCPVAIEEDSAGPADSETRRHASKSGLGDSELLQKRDTALSNQRNAPWDLVETSFPPNQTRNSNEYVYDSAGGAGSTIYVFDSGANMNNPVSQIALVPRGRRSLRQFVGFAKNTNETKVALPCRRSGCHSGPQYIYRWRTWWPRDLCPLESGWGYLRSCKKGRCCNRQDAPNKSWRTVYVKYGYYECSQHDLGRHHRV